MLAIGMDIEMVQSIRGKKFLHSCKAFFTQNELTYCNEKIESLTALICVKESCIKALSNLCGIPPYLYKDIELFHHKNGKPYICFHKELGEYMGVNKLRSELTISHTSFLASAIVVIHRECV